MASMRERSPLPNGLPATRKTARPEGWTREARGVWVGRMRIAPAASTAGSREALARKAEGE